MKQNNDPNLLNVHDVLPVSYANGPGRRTVVWTQGCSKRCPGCSNPLTHSHRPHVLLDPKQLAEAIATITNIEGVTITGGEPCEQALAVGRLCRLVREKNLSVMLFTGWEYEDLCKSSDKSVRELLSQIDILVSGPFFRHLADKNLIWRGSSNQQITFLTDRYSPEVLNDKNPPQVEGQFSTGRSLQITGFPDESDMKVLAQRLSVEAGIELEEVKCKRNENLIFGGKNHDCIRKNC